MSIAQAHALLTRPGSPFEIEEQGDPRRAAQGLEERARRPCATCWKLGRAHGDKTSWSTRTSGSPSRPSTARSSTFAAELQPQGVEKGDRVAMIMRNLPEWPVAFFAGQLVGADRHAR